MPGVEDVQRVDDRTFTGTIRAKVGPMSGEFSFEAQLLDTRPPDSMTAQVVGTDSVTKSTMTGRVALVLTEVGAEETRLDYDATVDIKGRLAILGDMMFRSTAGLMLQEFTKRVGEAVP